MSTARENPEAIENRIVGRTAVVTGAGNGLGRAISLALGRAGARVVLVGRTQASLEGVASELRQIGPPGRVEVADTSDPASVTLLARELSDEHVTILVNNAGIAGPVSDLVDIDPADWDEVFGINVRGVFLMCQAFLPPMIGSGTGDIINLASVSGKRPLAHRTPYAASKMAVLGLTASLAHEVGSAGVTVNCLSPGPVKGPRMARNFRLEAEQLGITSWDAEHTFVSRSALGRMVEESEVAQAVIAMLHIQGMTGADIDLSAGMVAR